MQFFQPDVRHRIGMLRQALRLSRAAFAEPLGIAATKVQDLERLRYQADEGLINKVLEVYKPSADWLRHGVGEMFGSTTIPFGFPVHNQIAEGAPMPPYDPRTGFFKSFGARSRQAEEMVNEVVSESRVKPNRLLFEALKTIAFHSGVTHEHLSLLLAGIEEQVREAREKAKG